MTTTTRSTTILSVRKDDRVAIAGDRDNALYVRLTQEDGHVVWSSPIYVFKSHDS